MKLRWYQSEAVKAMNDCTDNGVVVLPTGAGKTFVMKEFLKTYTGSVLLLSHVKEILTQNFEAVAELGAGLYSSGLGINKIERITVAGIQSVYNKPKLFSHVDLIIIDECHLVNDEGMYRTIINNLGVPYIGLTATPFRLKQGYIYKSGLFDSLIYEAPITRLQEEGYLSKIRMVGSVDEMDTVGLTMTGGDFNLKDAALRFNRSAITDKIVKGLEKYKEDYKHWLLFCIDISHAEEVSKALNETGITCATVHSKSPRDKTLLDFKSGVIQAVANVNILTVGFDYPKIDLIVMLRPTHSPTLHVQAIGRGLRIAQGKDHCLVKDFAGNTGRLGFIDDLAPIDKVKKGKGGVNPFSKTCPECEVINHPSVRVCICGHKFKFEHHLSEKAHKPAEWHDVTGVFYNIHSKSGSPDSLKITYACGLKKMFTQWVHIQHPGFAGYKARYWVSVRWHSDEPAPKTTDDLYINRGKLSVPKSILVEDATKYPKILNTKY